VILEAIQLSSTPSVCVVRRLQRSVRRLLLSLTTAMSLIATYAQRPMRRVLTADHRDELDCEMRATANAARLSRRILLTSTMNLIAWSGQ
jgi:hypothetical protein